MRKIVGIGETVLDVIFKNDKPQDAIPGGSSFNALISLGRVMRNVPRCAVPILMVTQTGDDHIGDMIVDFMSANGVDTSAVTRNPGTQSHISMAFLDSNNDARYEFYKDHANAGISAQKVDEICFGKDDIVLFGSFFAINPVIRSSTLKLLRKAREEGAILYYDINFRKSHIKDLPQTMPSILENISLSDFVRCSADDLRYLFGSDDGDAIYDASIRPLCRNFILTRGADSTLVYTGGSRIEIPVEKVDTVSTIGAGDNFNAGFVFSMIKYGITQHSCASLGAQELSRMASTASRFSAEACRSIYNYVGEDFVV